MERGNSTQRQNTLLNIAALRAKPERVRTAQAPRLSLLRI